MHSIFTHHSHCRQSQYTLCSTTTIVIAPRRCWWHARHPFCSKSSVRRDDCSAEFETRLVHEFRLDAIASNSFTRSYTSLLNPTFYKMSEQDETARLWKVNRTIHELVKDRVSIWSAQLEHHSEPLNEPPSGIPSVRRRNKYGPRDLQATLC